MSNFLVIVPSRGNSQEAKERFHHGVQFAKRVRRQKPSKQFEAGWVSVATFPRMNGSLCPLIFDEQRGDWVLVSGTWFHKEGWGSGKEQQLLRRLQQVGPEIVAQELEGFFGLVFGDSRRKKVSVVTDIIGSCHVFERIAPEFSAISGSSLILAGLSEVHLDPVACQEFLCTGVMYEDRTFYKEVRKLTPASVLSYYDGKKKEGCAYWHAKDLVPESLDGNEALEIVSQNLLRVVKTIGKIFPKPVCDLTGGYDSRSVVAAFLSAKVPFQTTVTGSPDSGDVKVSKAISDKFELPHWPMSAGHLSTFDDLKQILWLTDGEYDIIEYAKIFQVHRALMNRYDVSVNGSFGEVARGYWWELLFPNPAEVGKLNGDLIARKRYTVQMYDENLFDQPQRLDLCNHFGEVIERTNAGLWNFPKSFQMDHAYLRMRMQRWQGRIASCTNQIWPCLSPFMFRSILEPLLQIRVSFRRRNQFMSSLISCLQPELGNMPLEHGWPAVPFTLNTAYKFWPLPVYFGEKVLKRIREKCEFLQPKSTELSSIASQRLNLLKENTLKNLLIPSQMDVGNILDRGALKRFIQASKEEYFPFEKQWANVVTLELTLNQLKQARCGVNI